MGTVLKTVLALAALRHAQQVLTITYKGSQVNHLVPFLVALVHTHIRLGCWINVFLIILLDNLTTHQLRVRLHLVVILKPTLLSAIFMTINNRMNHNLIFFPKNLDFLTCYIMQPVCSGLYRNILGALSCDTCPICTYNIKVEAYNVSDIRYAILDCSHMCFNHFSYNMILISIIYNNVFTCLDLVGIKFIYSLCEGSSLCLHCES